jgi:adenylate kinase family enzyme
LELVNEATKDRSTSKLCDAPVLEWDMMRGLRFCNEDGARTMVKMGLANTVPNGYKITNPMRDVVKLLDASLGLPPKTVLFLHNTQLFIKEELVQQGVWNLRDQFKQDFRTLVMLAPDMTLPLTLSNDVHVIDEPLPTRDELAKVVLGLYEAYRLTAPSDKQIDDAVDAIAGLALFPAEQAVAMSFTRETQGLDLDLLWEKKKRAIEATKGLSVWRGDDSFDSYAGNANAISYLKAIVDGNGHPAAIGLLDEIEKMASTDTLGTNETSLEMIGEFLSWSEDRKAIMVLMVGVPGAGKTQAAKCLARYARKPLMKISFSNMKAGLMGESNQNIHDALKRIDAVAQGRPPLLLATSNNIKRLSPELRSRFKLGTIFYDLPQAAERKAIWDIYLKRYSAILKAEGKSAEHFVVSRSNPKPDDDNWTGREIESCCNNAYMLDWSLTHAAKFVVPVAVADPQTVKTLRQEASGRYISATDDGIYDFSEGTSKVVSVKRAVDVQFPITQLNTDEN